MSYQKVLVILFFFPIVLFAQNQALQSPEYYYNQALEQKADLGQAILNSKRAYRLAPNNMQIRDLFYSLRKELGLPSLYSEDPFYSKLMGEFVGTIRPQNRAIIGAVIILMLALFGSMLILKSELRQNKIFKISLICLGVIGTLLVIPSQIYYYTVFKSPEAVLINPTQTYEEASNDSMVLSELPAGTELMIVVKNGDYSLVKSIDGQESWVINSNYTQLFN